jgi:hypothetical protein
LRARDERQQGADAKQPTPIEVELHERPFQGSGFETVNA